LGVSTKASERYKWYCKSHRTGVLEVHSQFSVLSTTRAIVSH
jgi:hypothetical protein